MSVFQVVDDPAHERFELRRDGETVSHADYRLRSDAIVIDHVETEYAHRGNGYAARLMAGIVDIGASRQLDLVPVCSYAVSYLRHHQRTVDRPDGTSQL